MEPVIFNMWSLLGDQWCSLWPVLGVQGTKVALLFKGLAGGCL